MDKLRKQKTTIDIPQDMAEWIKKKGMTYNGAFMQGIIALQERPELNQELQTIRRNMDRYREEMIRLKYEGGAK